MLTPKKPTPNKESSLLPIGSAAPDFALTDSNGEVTTLSKIKAKKIVLFFYPKDDTPACTIEAKEFSASLTAFAKAGATVIGISGGTDKTKAKFCTKHKLKVTLLSDTDFAVAKSYNSFGEKTFMGRKYNGIFRNTFVLDDKKKIVEIFQSVKPEGHATEILGFIKGGVKASAAAPSVATPKKKKASTK